MGHQIRDNSDYKYFIMRADGEVLTSAKNPNQLRWTLQAMMEDTHAEAVLYHNPYKIPLSVSKQFADSDRVYRVRAPLNQHFMDFDGTLDAVCMGSVAEFRHSLPGQMQSVRTEHVYHERYW
tara:strand:+ start:119 stop:484 length:366 start_codon:yes stop_codon:yes gene_type:complete